MRISDWSSDVCSSDLVRLGWSCRQLGAGSVHLEPALLPRDQRQRGRLHPEGREDQLVDPGLEQLPPERLPAGRGPQAGPVRSEEHTSELQSLMRISYAVFCLENKTTPNTQYPSSMTPPI